MKKGCLIAVGVIIALMSIWLVYYFTTQYQKDPVVYEYVKPEINDVIKKAVASGSIKPRKEVNIKPQVSGVAKIRYNDAVREVERQRRVNNERLDVQQAEANYTLAEKELTRQTSLHEQGVISDQELQQFELDAELKKNTYENTKITATNNLASAEIEVEIRKQELDAAQNNLQLLREGKTSNSKQISNIVNSTMDGMVLDVPIEEGSSVIERNNFNEGTNIAVIADMGSLIFEGTIDESDVGKLKVGMPLVLKVGAIPNEEFKGILEFISPKGTEEEGTVNFKIKADIQNEDSNSFLRAGYSANADIILQQKSQVITVNERDIEFKDDKAFVEVVVGDQEFDEKEIQTGLSDGVLIEVVSGIDTTSQIKKKSDNVDQDD